MSGSFLDEEDDDDVQLTPNEAESSSIVDVHDEDAGIRLDKFLSAHLPELSRSRIAQLIEQGHVTCEGTCASASLKVRLGQQWRVAIPEAVPSHIAPQEIPLTIVYEDEHLLVIDKAAGMTVHPAPGNYDGTLVNALLAHCGDTLSGIGGVMRPGIVHRLDKDTSGLMVAAKHDTAHRALAAQLADHTLGRTYLAIVWGAPIESRGTYESNIGRSPANRKKMAVVKNGGKHAVTHWQVKEKFFLPGHAMPLASLIECRLETGRTHQIRVHLAHAGFPIIADPVYGRSKSRLHGKNIPAELPDAVNALARQALHAAHITFAHPETLEKKAFSSPLPEDMMALLNALQSLTQH